MRNELSYIAKSTNKVAKYVSLGCIGSALIVSLAGKIADVYAGLFALGVFAFIVAAIYIYTRYVGVEFCYQITEYSVPTLVISQLSGNRSRTVARIDIDSITDVKRLTYKEYRELRKREKSIPKYSYFPTMMPSTICFIAMRSEHENADIFVEADDSFISALTNR